VKNQSPGTKSNPPEKKEENVLAEEKKNDYNILNTSNQLFINNSNNVQVTKPNNDEIKLIKKDSNHENEVNTEYIDKISNSLSVMKDKNAEREERQFQFSYFELYVILFCPCFSDDKLKKKKKMFRTLVEHTKKY